MCKFVMSTKDPPLPAVPPQKNTNNIDSITNRHNNIDGNILFFNRVPKTGSENFVHILQLLSLTNGFWHVRYGSPEPRRLNNNTQMKQIRKIQQLHERPLSYDRHVYFIDFRKFGSPNPLYFAMVRDPVEKFQSR